MSDPIDGEAFAQTLEMAGGDLEFLGDLVAEYRADGAARIADMRAAFAGDQADELRRAAHTLKGSSASLGATALAEACRQVEAAARDGRLEGLDRDIAAIAAAFEAVVAALEARTGAGG